MKTLTLAGLGLALASPALAYDRDRYRDISPAERERYEWRERWRGEVTPCGPPPTGADSWERGRA